MGTNKDFLDYFGKNFAGDKFTIDDLRNDGYIMSLLEQEELEHSMEENAFYLWQMNAKEKKEEEEMNDEFKEKKEELEKELERLKEEESCQKKNIMSYLMLQWIYFWSNEETLLGKLKGRKAERWLRELEKEETNDSPTYIDPSA